MDLIKVARGYSYLIKLLYNLNILVDIDPFEAPLNKHIPRLRCVHNVINKGGRILLSVITPIGPNRLNKLGIPSWLSGSIISYTPEELRLRRIISAVTLLSMAIRDVPMSCEMRNNVPASVG